ncbi:MAG: 4-demethylwyosine synthase TYW1 [Candidatus Methanomethylicia archaeon]
MLMESGIMALPNKVEKVYYDQGYRFLGKYRHSAVKICHWTKESLRANRVCYKELWYPPVQSHRCMEMTPYLGCNCHCLYCWRTHSGDRSELLWREYPLDMESFDEPERIVEEAVERRKELLFGFKGDMKIDRLKFEEAIRPTMMTMSLTGEPTLYPKISELIVEARRRNMITFLVTNGTLPEVIEEIEPLPFQLYVSISAPDENIYNKIMRPLFKGGWEKMNKTLELFPTLNTRKVIRLTMIKGWNMEKHDSYAKLICKAEPNFVEVKAYEWVGESRKRLPRAAMPYMEDIRGFAEKLSELIGYKIRGEYEPSGVVLLASK